MSVPMDAVQLDLAGSDRSVVFVRVRTNPTSQVFACFRIQWTRALTSYDWNSLQGLRYREIEIQYREGCIKVKICCENWERQHVKQAVERGNLSTDSSVAAGPRKTAEMRYQVFRSQYLRAQTDL
jgi:hypothetical protein